MRIWTRTVLAVRVDDELFNVRAWAYADEVRYELALPVGGPQMWEGCSMDLVEVDNSLILRHFRPAPCLAPRIVQPGGLPRFP